CIMSLLCFFFSSRRRHTRFSRDWSSDVCSSDLQIHQELKDEYTLEFEGIGFALLGSSAPVNGSSWDYTGDYAATAELYIDDQKRSEERRVGKEYRTRSSIKHGKKKDRTT